MAQVDGAGLGEPHRARVVGAAASSTRLGRLSGSGAAGIGSWWSSPSASSWKEAIIDRIGLPYWIAWTRRVEKERPSRTFSTAKRMGWLSSPGRTK